MLSVNPCTTRLHTHSVTNKYATRANRHPTTAVCVMATSVVVSVALAAPSGPSVIVSVIVMSAGARARARATSETLLRAAAVS